MFSQEEIQQLKTMHLEIFGKEITDQEAAENTQMVLDLLTAVYKPNKKIWPEEM